jgi:hypothetical protein
MLTLVVSKLENNIIYDVLKPLTQNEGFFYFTNNYYLCNMIHDKLKKIIFNKLYKDLSKAEIIDFNDSIWFIDRDNKYWYFEYEKVGRLYWRYDFFPNFFSVFSLERNEFEPIMSEWIEEVLNCKVKGKSSGLLSNNSWVEDALNYEVNKTTPNHCISTEWVEKMLDCKVDTIQPHKLNRERTVEDTLNITLIRGQNLRNVDEVLDCKVDIIKMNEWNEQSRVEDVLNYSVSKTASTEGHQIGKVNQVLNYKVDTTHVSISNEATKVEWVLNKLNMDFNDDISDWDCTLMDGLEDE